MFPPFLLPSCDGLFEGSELVFGAGKFAAEIQTSQVLEGSDPRDLHSFITVIRLILSAAHVARSFGWYFATSRKNFGHCHQKHRR